MKKEDLVALGLTDEQIAGVQKLNGLDISAEQKKAGKIEVERDLYKDKLGETEEALKKFSNVNVDDLNNQINSLKESLANKDKEYAEKEFSKGLDDAITKAGGRNAKAIKALLDLDALKASKDFDKDFSAAIETCKKDNAYMFGSNEPINNPTIPAETNLFGDTVMDKITAQFAAAAGVKLE